jgi:hypothetical protein
LKHGRSILVVGLCQARHIGNILRAIPYVANRFDVCALEICADPIDGTIAAPPQRILETLECAYFQLGLTDTLPSYMAPLIAQGNTQRFPVLTCPALWPAHTALHRNPPEPGLPWGRFPYCDRVLIDLLDTGQDDAGIVEEYLETDMARMFDLDRLLEIWQWSIKELDKSCDIPMAELQWREWKQIRHYWALTHPTNQLIGRVLRTLLSRSIGPVPQREFLEALRNHELNEFMTPIHPTVARHFGLKWYSPEDRYTWPGGPFTIRQWALEHVRYTRRVMAELGA